MWREESTDHPTIKFAEMYQLDIGDVQIIVSREEGKKEYAAHSHWNNYCLLNGRNITDADTARFMAVIDTLASLPKSITDLRAAFAPMPVVPLSKRKPSPEPQPEPVAAMEPAPLDI
jgi:hypothetical protein